MEGVVNFEDMLNNQDALESNYENINEYFNIALYNFGTGGKYGDLKITTSEIITQQTDGAFDILIVYEDDSKDSMLELGSDLIKDIEKELE